MEEVCVYLRDIDMMNFISGHHAACKRLGGYYSVWYHAQISRRQLNKRARLENVDKKVSDELKRCIQFAYSLRRCSPYCIQLQFLACFQNIFAYFACQNMQFDIKLQLYWNFYVYGGKHKTNANVMISVLKSIVKCGHVVGS